MAGDIEPSELSKSDIKYELVSQLDLSEISALIWSCRGSVYWSRYFYVAAYNAGLKDSELHSEIGLLLDEFLETMDRKLL